MVESLWLAGAVSEGDPGHKALVLLYSLFVVVAPGIVLWTYSYRNLLTQDGFEGFDVYKRCFAFATVAGVLFLVLWRFCVTDYLQLDKYVQPGGADGFTQGPAAIFVLAVVLFTLLSIASAAFTAGLSKEEGHPIRIALFVVAIIACIPSALLLLVLLIVVGATVL